MLRPVPEVADMETWLGPASRCVDPVFQHSQRHNVGFVPDLVEVGSVEFVEDAVEHVALFFVAKKAGAQRFIIDARASNRLFFEISIWTVACRRGTLSCRKFTERLRKLRTGLSVQPISRTRFIRCGVLYDYRRFLPCLLFSHPKLATQEKTVDQKRLAPGLFDISCSYNASDGFFLGDAFLSRCHGPSLLTILGY